MYLTFKPIRAKAIRVNIGNASIFGLKRDLSLEGNQYNTALVIL